MTNKRIELVDALRGFALLGLFLVHCVERFEVIWIDPQPDAWFDGVFALFGSKAFAIFALLFGFSFATIMGNERARGGDFTMRFTWRLVLLFAFGTFHAIFYRGDILQVLAVIGLLLIPFDRVKSDRVLLAIAALAFLQLPQLVRLWAAGQGQSWATADPLYFTWGSLPTLVNGTWLQVAADNLGPGTVGKWSYYLETGRVMEIVGLFLVGMVAQRRSWFAVSSFRWKGWLTLLVVAAVLWALATWFLPAALTAMAGQPAQAQAREWLASQWTSLFAMAFQVALFVQLWHTALRGVLSVFAAPGRMTLTLYIGQSLVAVPLLYGYGLGLWDDISHAQAVLIGLVAFAAQAALAAWWFRHYRYGPLEWLWRAATRTTFDVPFRGGAQMNGEPTAR
ncbi:DUF418 domain-containing protein [Altererythrobacter salegens]|uniref:DUF418 domain-containing protein n=1 Tax=Croceibacterium salegens TaxID=1737568 RepID=A0A6I4T3B2_9SPHN|nr:DUF418 domain-containing protein [Croceibacterium salegens]MXO61222.1 DUF418 domain-containing protein [Croceibacterium salegens]